MSDQSNQSSDVSFSEAQFNSTDGYQVYKDASHDRHRIEREFKEQARELKELLMLQARELKEQARENKERYDTLDARLGRFEDWAEKFGDLDLYGERR